MISQELQDFYTGNQQDGVLIQTVEISHSLLPEIYRLCDFYTPLKLIIEDGTKQTFLPANFAVSHPAFENKGTLEYSFNFSNVSFKYIQEINKILNKNNELIQIKYRIYSSKNFNYPLLDFPFIISISDIGVTKQNVSMAGQQLESLLKRIPKEKYGVLVFKGLQE